MNLFQWLTVPVLLLLILNTLKEFWSSGRRIRFVRLATYVIAAVLILFPGLTSLIANSLGIGRGTDLVMYGFMLTSTGIMLHFYGRQFTLRRDLVELIRREALRTPVAGRGLAEHSIHSNSEENNQRQRGDAV